MDRKILIGIFVFVVVVAALSFYLLNLRAAQSGSGQGEVTEVRLGYFPNILHAQALVGTANGEFQKELGEDVKLETLTFNAGPSAIEALFANEVDIVYIGPNPAINGYVKSEGEALRIISGAASGGAVFVISGDSDMDSASDMAGKKFASPQLGNTQDVALRAYIQSNGLEIGSEPGQVQVIPTENPNILLLLQKKEIDGAWVPEPWGARLVQEGGGKVYLDERDIWPEGKFVTAHVIVRKQFLDEHPGLVKKFLRAHIKVTQWINQNPEDAKTMMNNQIKLLTQKELPIVVLDEGFSRCEITYDPVSESLFSSSDAAYTLGMLGDENPDLSGIYDLTLLREVLEEEGLSLNEVLSEVE